jgi:hypothetical protein
MSWAAKRRLMYVLGILCFFFIVVVLPIFWSWYSSRPPACPTGTYRAQDSASGPCDYLDETMLQPHAVLWARAFQVRTGVYDAVAYIQNPNIDAGVLSAPYQFSFYDDQNVLVAQQSGVAYIMPQSVTPVFIGNVASGNRIITHTYFQLGSALTWQKLKNTVDGVAIDGKSASNTTTMPEVTAIARNTTVADLSNLTFVVVVFDPAGNAIAASQTALPLLKAGDSAQIIFTWPAPLSAPVGRIDIIPLATPVPLSS